MASTIHSLSNRKFYIDGIKLENLPKDNVRTISKINNYTSYVENYAGKVINKLINTDFNLTIQTQQGTATDELLSEIFVTGGLIVHKFKEIIVEDNTDVLYTQINKLYPETMGEDMLGEESSTKTYTFYFFLTDCPLYLGTVPSVYKQLNV